MEEYICQIEKVNSQLQNKEVFDLILGHAT